MITSDRLQMVKEMITQLAYLLYYNYFNNYYKMIAIDLSKQQALDPDPKAIQQISFNSNRNRNGDTNMLFIIEGAKESILDFSQDT